MFGRRGRRQPPTQQPGPPPPPPPANQEPPPPPPGNVINRLIRRYFSRHAPPNPPSELADLLTEDDDNPRPATAPTEHVDEQVFRRFVNMRINDNVRRRPDAFSESRAAASQFQSNPQQQSAFMLNAMQGVRSFEQNTDNERGVVIRDHKIPTNDLFGLQPCDAPPKPSEVEPFHSLFINTLFKDWLILQYLENNDPIFMSLYQKKVGMLWRRRIRRWVNAILSYVIAYSAIVISSVMMKY